MTTHAAKPSGSEIPFDLAMLPEPAIQILLVREWLKCFQQNADFKAYCEAKRNRDAETCATLEQAHTRFVELYEDWGDIHILPSLNEDRNWWDWFEPRQHLFSIPDVEIADPIDWPAEPDGTTLVAIPNGLRKEQLLQVFADFVSSHPEILGDGPKYKVTPIKGERPIDTLKRVQRAYTAHISLDAIPWNRHAVKSLPEKLARTLLRSPKENRFFGFNWFVHGEVNKKLLEQNKLPSDDLKSYRRTLDNLRKFYQASIDDTIHGTFPAAPKA
ncbi:Uncharacterised protein [Burkholderia pseudomallei]|uniref:hypothetical protein n=1 Tax=Burkholderia pseudomallei TaxID=28450 RepID=UPI000F0954FE|nr:hypothetical protein [Burkholderia pseudomallei]VBM56240.1 Uncharacterised protein [Burkholderia pseudomallei]